MVVRGSHVEFSALSAVAKKLVVDLGLVFGTITIDVFSLDYNAFKLVADQFQVTH